MRYRKKVYFEISIEVHTHNCILSISTISWQSFVSFYTTFSFTVTSDSRLRETKRMLSVLRVRTCARPPFGSNLQCMLAKINVKYSQHSFPVWTQVKERASAWTSENLVYVRCLVDKSWIDIYKLIYKCIKNRKIS